MTRIIFVNRFFFPDQSATSRMVSCASTREGRRRFFERTLPGQDRSLQAPARCEGDGDRSAGGAIGELMPADEDHRPDVICEGREYRAQVRRALAAFRPTLDERQRSVLDLRLLREKPARLEDVGKRFAVSGERVRQLEAGVRRDLRTFMAAAMGEPERAVA